MRLIEENIAGLTGNTVVW